MQDYIKGHYYREIVMPFLSIDNPSHQSISSGNINGLENRKGLPSMAVFFYICDFLEVTPSEFFNVDIEEPQKLKELYEEIKSFDSERLELLARLIKYMR